jgi:hypothetical protein
MIRNPKRILLKPEGDPPIRCCGRYIPPHVVYRIVMEMIKNDLNLCHLFVIKTSANN